MKSWKRREIRVGKHDGPEVFCCSICSLVAFPVGNDSIRPTRYVYTMVPQHITVLFTVTLSVLITQFAYTSLAVTCQIEARISLYRLNSIEGNAGNAPRKTKQVCVARRSK